MESIIAIQIDALFQARTLLSFTTAKQMMLEYLQLNEESVEQYDMIYIRTRREVVLGGMFIKTSTLKLWKTFPSRTIQEN